MGHHHHRYWRPPWEEVETRTGGYYGRRGYDPTAADEEGYPLQGDSGRGYSCEVQRMHSNFQYHRPPEYYGGSGNERTGWDGYYGCPHNHCDDYCCQVPSERNGSSRSSYNPPSRLLQQQSRVSQDPYSYNRQVNDEKSFDRRNDDAAYGIGLPVTSAHGGSPPPPSTISTSSAPSADDSSNEDSQGAGAAAEEGMDQLFDGVYAARANRESNQLSSPTLKRTTIELIPGVKMVLRGAKETWDAFRRKFYVAVTCIGCSSKIFCIKDADYVLCPVCRVVSPLELKVPSSSSSQRRNRRIGGLGLGFTGEQDLRSQRENKKIMEQMS